MADELDNKKNIEDSKKALDQFNDTIKDSIDLSKQLSKAVSSIPAELKLSESKNKSLIRGAQDYNKLLNDTLKLSDKIAKGKAKEKEVQDQIAKIAKEGKKFIDENNTSFGKGNRFIKAQKKLQEEINFLQALQLKRQGDLEEKVKKITQIEDQIEAQKERRLINSQEKRLADARIKELKENLKEEEKSVRALDEMIKSEEKRLSIKAKEKKTVDDSIESYKDLVALFTKLLLLSKDIEGTVKETTFEKLKSEDIEKRTQGFKELLSIAGSIGAVFKPALDLFFKVSAQTTQLQKNLVLSKDEAYALRQEFNNIAVASNDIAITNARLLEANASLSQQLGFSSKFTTDLNTQFVKLTKQLGLSEEAAGGLAKLSIATGATLEESKNIAYETTQALSAQYGIQLTQREVLEEVGKLSGQVLAMFKASPQALTEAVAQAKLLGTNLNTAAKQASSLLDFETSIENELQAELLTGQQLNLERARTAALTGDLTTAMQELNNQNIDFNKFSNMNVIAQGKVAAALGLSSDELSDQLLKQQYMNMSQEEVVALAGEEVAKRVEALNAQDKFNLAMEKVQDIVAKLIGGPFGSFVDMMADLANNSAVLYGALTAMAGLSLAKLIMGLTTMLPLLTTEALAATTIGTVLSGGLALAGILTAIGLVAAALGAFSSDDAEPAGDMFSSNGKTIVSPKEGGLFSLSDNDEFAAAPGLGDMISNANKQTIIAQDNTALLDAITKLNNTMSDVKGGVDKLYDKKPVVFDPVEQQTRGHQKTYNFA